MTILRLRTLIFRSPNFHIQNTPDSADPRKGRLKNWSARNWAWVALSGILAIAAIKLGAESVVALDIDSQAVRAARQNFRHTRVQRKVTLGQGSVPHALAGNGSFDLVVANISARAVRERAPFILPTLAPQGRFVASGILKTQQEEVDDSLAGLGCSLERQWPQDEWVTLVYRPESA